MSNTHGTWLPGDPRGFRTRGHREHVEGDYRTPPKEDYSCRHDQSKRQLKQPPVILTPEARAAAVESIRKSLVKIHGLEVLAISVSGMHLHLLARFPSGEKPTPTRRGLPLRQRDPVRFFVGISKERSAKHLKSEGLVPDTAVKVWGRKGKIKRVHDRDHQLHVFQYILDHALESAAVWSFREGVDSTIAVPPQT
jgi:hypothetical protein